jgi:hypothetical protein
MAERTAFGSVRRADLQQECVGTSTVFHHRPGMVGSNLWAEDRDEAASPSALHSLQITEPQPVFRRLRRAPAVIAQAVQAASLACFPSAP